MNPPQFTANSQAHPLSLHRLAVLPSSHPRPQREGGGMGGAFGRREPGKAPRGLPLTCPIALRLPALSEWGMSLAGRGTETVDTAVTTLM